MTVNPVFEIIGYGGSTCFKLKEYDLPEHLETEKEVMEIAFGDEGSRMQMNEKGGR